MKFCDICKGEIVNDDFNNFFNKYTHKNCDDKILEEQEKKVKYLKYSQEVKGEC